MSRSGLAYSLSYYRLRSRVVAKRADEDRVLIDVMGLAEVRYARDYMGWVIQRKGYKLVYYLEVSDHEVAGTWGYCSWEAGWAGRSSRFKYFPGMIQMNEKQFWRWSRWVLGWRLERDI